MSRILPLTILLSMVGVGCTATEFDGAGTPSIASPSGPSPSRPAVPDLSGEWTWSNLETLKMPPFIAISVGIAPEGENTHARCESAGTMALVQTGATFSGTARKTFNACETHGGQTFQQPQVSAPLTVTDGRIQGRNIQFSLNSPTVAPCPHKAVVSQADGDTATALSGTGHCILPGHPQSGSPIVLDPPAGTTKTLSWTAARQ